MTLRTIYLLNFLLSAAVGSALPPLINSYNVQILDFSFSRWLGKFIKKFLHFVNVAVRFFGGWNFQVCPEEANWNVHEGSERGATYR